MASRPNDAFGASFLYTHISSRVTALDGDTALFVGRPTPQRNFQLSFEFNYSFYVRSGWTFQPNVAVVFNPGGGVLNPEPRLPGERLRDAVLVGARSVWKY